LENREFNSGSIKALIGSWMGMFVGTGPLIAATTSLFMVPLSKEFGLTRTVISAVALIAPATIAVFSPIFGRALDRWGVRRVVLPVVVLFALAHFALWKVVSEWQLIALYVFLGICGSVHCMTAYTKVVSLWFSRNRGLAIGLIVSLGNSGGAAIAPQFVRLWIRDYGWRGAYLGMGLVITCLGLPVLFWLVREPSQARPRESKALPEAQLAQPEAQLQGLSRREAAGTLRFWMLLVVIFLSPMCVMGTVAHCFPLITERGFSAALGATAISFIYCGGLLGNLTAGFLMDRIESPRIVIPYLGAALVGVAILHHVHTGALMLTGAAVLGICQGSEMGIAAYLTTRFFGVRSFGGIYGILFAVANVGAATGILTMGYLHTRAGSYAPVAIVFEISLAVMVAIACLFPGYAFSARKTNAKQTQEDLVAAEA
jgi:MFS family permease